MMNRTKDGFKFFFNSKTMEYTWSRTDDVIKDHSLLTKDEIQVDLSGPEVIKHEILNAHKYKNIKKYGFFSAQISLKCYFSCS